MLLPFLALAAGLAVGAVIAWLAANNRNSADRHRAETLVAELADRSRALEGERARVSTLEKEAARLEERLSAEKRALEQISNSMQAAFGSAAAKALQENNRSFLAIAQLELGKQQGFATQALESKEKAIETLLKPVGQALEKLQTTTHDLEVKREGAYQSVIGAVKAVAEVGDRLGAGTRQLMEALRRPQVRGNWGQEQLERCIEFAGMVEHVSFEKEVVTAQGMRPDCIVHLPNDRMIVIDVKTPMEALLNAGSCTEESERELLLAAHARNVREHVKELSSKGYWKQFDESPDFVVCFLPSEASFSAALEQDAALIEYGSRANVILATPTTLIALLKAVAYGWQQMDITRNAIAIREAAEKLYDKLTTARNYFDSLGNSLKRSMTLYNNLVGCVEGRESVFDQARKMHELGIGHNEIPETMPALEPATRELKADDWKPDSQAALEFAAVAEDAGKQR
ncbi:MAG TPA: DNA recombination protein RmuC [Acidobacteriaceae bacterium]|jgi:DNA recombination protein RmuC